VLSVDATGCNSGDFHMSVLRSGLDGGIYTVHTHVTVGGLAYMNEAATISINGTSDWSVYNNFSYGPVPNQGAIRFLRGANDPGFHPGASQGR
jgi:hypothetical protein